jgi:hypothetical protein
MQKDPCILELVTAHCCGSQMVLPPISIRSALFALRKIGVIDEDDFKKHEKEWAMYRKANSLDSYGNIES